MAGATGRRYAQVAFALAQEHEGVDRWLADLERTAEVLEDSDVIALLSAPQVPDQVKLDGIGTLLVDVAPLVRNLVNVMVLRGDTAVFGRTLEVFRDMADASKGTARAEVVTAVPLDDARRDRLAKGLAELVGIERVELTETVDPGIVGGVIARVGDKLIDGSTRTRFQRMRRELAAGPR